MKRGGLPAPLCMSKVVNLRIRHKVWTLHSADSRLSSDFSGHLCTSHKLSIILILRRQPKAISLRFKLTSMTNTNDSLEWHVSTATWFWNLDQWYAILKEASYGRRPGLNVGMETLNDLQHKWVLLKFRSWRVRSRSGTLGVKQGHAILTS